MAKYKFLAVIYLVSLVSYSVANLIGADVQNFYRIPFLSVKWIDVAILLVICGYFYNAATHVTKLKGTGLIVTLCFIYLIFESFQLYRSWGLHDAASQTSRFICTLSLFIVIDLSSYTLSIEKIVSFLKKYAIAGAVVLFISNIYLLYSFFKGNTVFEDLDIRVALEVVGSKETVYSTVLTPFVYAFGLYFIQWSEKFWVRIVFLCAILSIYLSMIITFYRGTFVTILLITLYFLFIGKFKQTVVKAVGIVALMGIVYLFFGDTLAKKGYDPIQKIEEVAKFTTDVNNPDWDKGRSVSQEYAIKAWKKNFWIGAAYDELLHYGLPLNVATAHNGFITSLFHRGVLGTLLLVLILVLLFKYSVNLWFVLNFENNHESDMIRLLVMVSFFWIISFMTQEALWEKFSLCIQYMYLGLICNIYKQKLTV